MTVIRPYLMHFVSDMDRAVRFYTEAFGLTPRYQSPFWTEIAVGDASIALHPGEPSGERAGVLGLYVDDIQAACAAVQKAGGTMLSGPTATDHGHTLADVADTEGNPINLAQQTGR